MVVSVVVVINSSSICGDGISSSYGSSSYGKSSNSSSNSDIRNTITSSNSSSNSDIRNTITSSNSSSNSDIRNVRVVEIMKIEKNYDGCNTMLQQCLE